MMLKAVFLGLEAGGKSIAIMNAQDAERLGVLSLARITIRFDDLDRTAIVHTTTDLMPSGCIGLFKKVWASLGLVEGLDVDVDIAPFPASLLFIRRHNLLNK